VKIDNFFSELKRRNVLVPGLWDDHQHFSDNDGALDLANGVTGERSRRCCNRSAKEI